MQTIAQQLHAARVSMGYERRQRDKCAADLERKRAERLASKQAKPKRARGAPSKSTQMQADMVYALIDAGIERRCEIIARCNISVGQFKWAIEWLMRKGHVTRTYIGRYVTTGCG